MKRMFEALSPVLCSIAISVVFAVNPQVLLAQSFKSASSKSSAGTASAGSISSGISVKPAPTPTPHNCDQIFSDKDARMQSYHIRMTATGTTAYQCFADARRAFDPIAFQQRFVPGAPAEAYLTAAHNCKNCPTNAARPCSLTIVSYDPATEVRVECMAVIYSGPEDSLGTTYLESEVDRPLKINDLCVCKFWDTGTVNLTCSSSTCAGSSTSAKGY